MKKLRCQILNGSVRKTKDNNIILFIKYIKPKKLLILQNSVILIAI